jgi:predicted MFS family arabinose efflux permease
MSLAVFADFEPIPILFILVFVMGSTIAFQNTALQPLQADIVGSERLGNAISVTSFGQRSVGVVGALSGGVLIGWLGPAPTFLIAAVPLACAALVFASVRQPARHPRRGSRFIAEVVEGLRMIVSTPMVRLLLGMMILVEILGFSYNGLLPAIADRVLNVGPERLGILTAGASVGSMFGALILVLTADRFRRGLMLIGVFVTFGALLMVLGNSTIFWLSVVAVAGIGASAAMVDVLEWIMLQDSVPDELRGRALGGWNFAIGWGWIGPIALGAIAEATNVPTALTLSGAVLLVSAMVTFLLAKSLRVR